MSLPLPMLRLDGAASRSVEHVSGSLQIQTGRTVSARIQAFLPALLGAVGLSLIMMTAIWAFWPQTTPPKSVVNRQRPPQPTIQQAPQSDATATAYAQFWLEEQANAYARRLEIAHTENRPALEALLNQTLAEIADLKAKQATPVASAASPEQRWFISVHSRDH